MNSLSSSDETDLSFDETDLSFESDASIPTDTLTSCSSTEPDSSDSDSELSTWSECSETEMPAKEYESSKGPMFKDVSMYDGAQMTYFESLLLLFRYSLLHALTKRAFEDLLRLVALFIPISAKGILPLSMYRMKRISIDIFPHVPGKKIPYCSDCHTLLDKVASMTCSKETCSGRTNEFVYISLIQQLKLKLAGECIVYLFLLFTVESIQLIILHFDISDWSLVFFYINESSELLGCDVLCVCVCVH